MSGRKAREARWLAKQRAEENAELLDVVEVVIPGERLPTVSAIRRQQLGVLLDKAIVREVDGVYEAVDPEIYYRAIDLNPALCDFCAEPDPVWRYPCEDTFSGLAEDMKDATWFHKSVGAWTACDPCAELVEADQRDELALRGARVMVEKMPGMPLSERALFGQVVRFTHETFWRGKRGNRLPIQSEQR